MQNEANTRAIADQLATLSSQLRELRAELARVVVGQDEVVEGVLLALLAGGHVLLEGVPGLGKTLLVRSLAQVLDLQFSRVQFTPDLMPSDIVGAQLLGDDGRGGRNFSFQPGPVFTNILLADEVNRATPKTQSALLEAMAERSVTVGRTTHALPAPFFVLATQNPLEMEGTYPLPEAQLDRFFFKLQVPYPKDDELLRIATRSATPESVTLRRVLDGPQLRAIAEFAAGCPMAPHVADYVVQLVAGSQGRLKAARSYLRGGASPRAAQALVLGSKLRALLQGRENAAIDDVRALAAPVLRHRLLLNFDAEADGVRTDAVVEQLLAELDRGR
jgi:MoxR-like ATPase